MLRIVSGKYKNRKLIQPPKEITRATKDVAKEGLFNSLGDLTNLTFLDAFSGSGNIGIEALSRGAKFVTFVDINKDAIQTIVTNLNVLGIKKEAEVIKGNFFNYINKFNKKYDIIFLDPPYKEVINFQLINELFNNNVIDNESIIIIERENSLDDELLNNFTVKTLKYGRTFMYILRSKV